MKKILIVNNNLDMGGIQRSLINLLKEMHTRYDITLLLFSPSGALLKDVPENVKIITPCKRYRMLGLTKSELKKYPLLFVLKACLMKFTSLFSRRSAMRLLGLFQKKIGGYDAVISYSHLSHHKYFGNGCGDFVLDKTVCGHKICLIHCDYLNSGYMTDQNNREYREFDRIACCSESVRDRFIQGSAVSKEKVYTLRNFYDLDIRRLSCDAPYDYDPDYINLLTVARLSTEKGIDRAIDALFHAGRRDIRYYVVGDGPQRSVLEDKIRNYRMEKLVFLLDEQQNPYRYMLNADYLLVPSLHEAAPMVFDEARIMGLPVVSTNTTSAEEMLPDAFGFVCENCTEAITEVVEKLNKRAIQETVLVDNSLQMNQMDLLLGA